MTLSRKEWEQRCYMENNIEKWRQIRSLGTKDNELITETKNVNGETLFFVSIPTRY